jgi:hypothetical protein
MKKLVISLAALASVATVLPASAQTWNQGRYGGYERQYDRGDYNRGYNRNGGAQLNQQFASLASRIDSAFRRGEISRYEASRLSTDLRSFQSLRITYSRNGMSSREARSIEKRLRDLNINLERARRGENPYGGGNRRYSYDNDRYGNRW